MVSETLISKELHMGDHRNTGWGVLAIAAAALFVGAAYFIFTTGGSPSAPFAIGEYGLLGSILVVIVDSLAKCRASH